MTNTPTRPSIRRMATGLYGLMLLGLVGTMAAPMSASAQDAPPPPATTQAPPADAKPDAKPGDAPADATTVTIQGKKAQNRIDRQVYDTKSDIDAQTGTAADALNKVPSVNVDPEGNVTLRGQSSVQVYVDGKPSAMMKGDNRAATLQSMGSGDIDSIEVMNNPGAQFSAEGTGGIINIVMKKNRRPGASGTIIVNAGSQGRYNATFSGSRNTGKLTLSGGASFRHDGRDSRSTSTQQRFDSNGVVIADNNQSGLSENHFDNLSLNGGVDYVISDIDTVSTQLGYGKRTFDNESLNTYQGFDINGPVDYVRNSTGEGDREDTSATFHWDHTGDQPAETLKFDLRVSTSNGGNTSASVNDYALAGKDDFNDLKTSTSRTGTGVFSIDYARNVGDGQLSLGTQTTIDDNHFINTSVLPDCVNLAANDPRCQGNASLNNDFAYKQILNAAYITFQQPIGEKWIVQGGLRSETIDLTTRQLTTHTTGNTNYTKLVPSAFATYTLSDNAKLRFSYSHRLRRPNPQDLNPYVVFVDAQNLSAGNPDLKPSESDSFELGYEYQKQQLSWQLRGYYRKSTNQITDVSFFSSPGVITTTKQNLGEGQSGGVEFNFNNKIGTKLSLSFNGNLGVEELNTPNGGKQSGTTLRGRGSIDYQITPKDKVQLGMFSSGRQLTGQGYRSPFSMGNLSYRHQINPKTALTVTVNDPFRTGKNTSVTDTANIYSISTRSVSSPTFYVGLSYILGGASQGQQDQNGPNRGQGQWQGGRGNWGGPGGGGPGGGGGMGPGGGF